MHLAPHLAVLSPYSDRLLFLVGDVTRIILALSLAHLAAGIAHNIGDLLAKNDHPLWRLLRTTCHVAVDTLLYVIAGLYALEYLSMTTMRIS